MRVRSLILVLAALAVVGCGPRWPADTVAKPSFAKASDYRIAKHKFMSYSVAAEAQLPAYAKARSENLFYGPKGSEMFVFLSIPWPMEEEAMPTVIGKLKEGKPLNPGDSLVVAKPWIGSKEEKDAMNGLIVERYLLMTEDLFLDVVVRSPKGSSAAKEEGAEMVQHLLHSIKRAPYVQETAYRDAKSDQQPSKTAPLASLSSLP